MSEKQIVQALAKLWWLPLLRGILLLVLGMYALLTPGMTVIALTQVIAFWMIAEGILNVLAAIVGETDSRLWSTIRGVLLILAGIFVFTHSAIVAGLTATTVLYVIAFFAVLGGILEIVSDIRNRKQLKGEGWMILSGALMVIFGILLFVAPLSFGLFMVRVLGAIAIINGIALIVIAFRFRSLGRLAQG